MGITEVGYTKYLLSELEKEKCKEIIHKARTAVVPAAVGLAQIPIANNAVITPIQIKMIISLGEVFDQKITTKMAKSLLKDNLMSVIGVAALQNTVMRIPGWGNIGNATMFASVTKSIGWLCVDYFYEKKYACKDINIEEQSRYKSKEMEADSNRELLKVRVSEFLNKGKNRKDNKEEFNELLALLTDYVAGVKDESDEMYKYLKELMELM